MKKKIILTFCWFILFFSLFNLITPDSEELIYHPLVEHNLTTIDNKNIKINEQFPDKAYLIMFYVDTSPTSKRQLKELNSIVDKLPVNIIPILIHIGPFNSTFSENYQTKFNIFSDINGQMAEKMNIYIVPTTMLLTKNYYQIFYTREFISAEEILEFVDLYSSKFFTS